jgi:LytS/YehU family sensor histidine kinase
VLAVTGLSVALLSLGAQPLRFVDDGVYFALNFLFICLLCSHAVQVRADEQKRTAALLKTARLELEMTKRHMQPHFLMNTLTALSEWIEQEPGTAIVMIDALAEELRILGHMSAERLVTAEDELRLCRSHLTTMSLRKDITYTLETDGVDPAQLVPPTVFHTMVENAVTHGPSSQRNVLLRLGATRRGEWMHYTFESPLDHNDDGAREPGDGTRYIEARLSEVWGDAWSLRQAPTGSHWLVEMAVPA